MTNNYENGINILKEITDENGEQMIKSVGEIFPDFLEKMISFGFGQIYARPNLDLKTREVVTITSLITQGAFEQLGFHIKAALKVGLTQEEILEIIMQCAAYSGFPKACSAVGIAGEIFKNGNYSVSKC
ncbi:carboxymuconolactone decarboxylase [Clostridium beijerinckii]|uniref:Carboxymuconolactone decarboxylase n=1 Tax=Clostridium beijerinckii TaxID=1520 RepID=A0A0B5QBF5_CLOBE|nr:carboxymuconolactone decarboxylase family protein [Clostridium beijerinckii]AJG98260.1 carboxymuconolactone decarboxylase [Clostridium beijerinckii]